MPGLHPSTRRDPVTELVHVVAYDGVRFCGPWHDTTGHAMPRVDAPVTCVACACSWTRLAIG